MHIVKHSVQLNVEFAWKRSHTSLSVGFQSRHDTNTERILRENRAYQHEKIENRTGCLNREYEDVGFLKVDICTDPNAYASLLQDCIKNKSLVDSKRVHGCIIKIGFQRGTFIWNRLMDTYTKCGSLDNARQVFDKMFTKDTISWNTMIGGYAKFGSIQDARQLFDRMPE